jgi:membrane-associated protease RseP (regulator of RpoE activity)
MIFFSSILFIIIFHELGHLLAAKLCKCGVKVFSIGFGKPLFQIKTKKTIYQLSPFLLGGYCELQDELKYTRSKYSFTNKKYSQKVFISLAGIFMNCIIGFISCFLAKIFYNEILFIFGCYSIIIGLSNLLPIPALDGSYPIAFLFEKKYGKRKCYEKISSIFSKWFIFLIVLNLASIPILLWQIYTGQLL